MTGYDDVDGLYYLIEGMVYCVMQVCSTSLVGSDDRYVYTGVGVLDGEGE